jgi:hypothetical protein
MIKIFNMFHTTITDIKLNCVFKEDIINISKICVLIGKIDYNS